MASQAEVMESHEQFRGAWSLIARWAAWQDVRSERAMTLAAAEMYV